MTSLKSTHLEPNQNLSPLSDPAGCLKEQVRVRAEYAKLTAISSRRNALKMEFQLDLLSMLSTSRMKLPPMNSMVLVCCSKIMIDEI